MKEVDKLIKDNMGLVRHIAKQIDVSYMQYEDLVSEGTIGLIKAARTYDENREIKFSTYSAKCIRNEMLMYLRKENNYINAKSIDDIIYEDTDGSKLELLELIADKRDYYEERERNEELENILNWILNLENSRIRTIILLQSAGMKQKIIGEKLNISQSYISRLEGKVQKNLKRSMNGEIIKNPKCKVVREEGFFIINFYKENIKNYKKFVEAVNEQKDNIDLTYFEVNYLENDVPEIRISEEENSMIFLANLLNQIA